MPVFTYTARDGTGNQTSGTVEAESNSRAVAALREKGLWVTDIRTGGRRVSSDSVHAAEGARATAAPQRDDSVAKRMFSPVSAKDLSLFYRQLYTLLNSGVAIFQSMEMLSQQGQTPNESLRRVVAEMARHVLAGGRFSEAMARYPWLFDRMQVRMVEAGEAGGLLVEIFRRLAEYLEREYEIRQQIRQKTLYPKLVLGLLFLVLPINVPLTLAGYLRDITSLAILVAGFAIPVWLVTRLLFTSPAGRDMYDRLKLAIPVIGPVVRKMAVARFARSLAALYGAGVPIGSALGMAGESCGNYALQQGTLRVVPAVERGTPIAQSLEATHFFPHMFIGMVQTGETSGNLDTMLDKAADFFEEEASHSINQLVVTLGVVILVIAAILVAIKLITFYVNYVANAMGGGAAGDGGAAGE